MKKLLLFGVMSLSYGCGNRSDTRVFDCSKVKFDLPDIALSNSGPDIEAKRNLSVANVLLFQLCFLNCVSSKDKLPSGNRRAEDTNLDIPLVLSSVSASVSASIAVLSVNTAYLKSIQINQGLSLKHDPRIISVTLALGALSSASALSEKQDQYSADSLRCLYEQASILRKKYINAVSKQYANLFVLSPTQQELLSGKLKDGIASSIRLNDFSFNMPPSYVLNIIEEERIVSRDEIRIFEVLQDRVFQKEKISLGDTSVAVRLIATKLEIVKMKKLLEEQLVSSIDSGFEARCRVPLARSELFLARTH